MRGTVATQVGVSVQPRISFETVSAPQTGREPDPAEWNATEMPFPRERSVVDFFRGLVQSQPEAVAVSEGSRQMSYRELDWRSNRVANELLRRGLKPEEEPVATLLPVSCKFLVAVLGILKAGGCYLPLDPETPAKRLEFLLGDSRSRLALSDAASLQRFQDWPGTPLDVEQIVGNSSAADDQDPLVVSDPHRRVYIIYTSGSTGQPKGVEVEHHSLTNLVCAFKQRFSLTSKDRSSMLAHIAFDASVGDLWPVFCAGGAVIIPPKNLLHDPDGLIAWLASEELTLAFVPTGLAEILFVREWPKVMKLRFLISGGDRLRMRPLPNLPFIVINGYGPTENTVACTFSVVSPEDGRGEPPAIGRPTANVKAYVLDEQRQPLPVGEAGELYLGGEQVARGYVGRPELTREHFLADPFVASPTARMYRTGDWVRWLPEGELEFLGRNDDQVQIRGYRVELGEVEERLFAHGSLQQVCCLPRLLAGIPSSIVAHIVPRQHGSDLSGELKSYLKAYLPCYMVPSEFVIHAQLPLTPQGKIDRAIMKGWQPLKIDPSARAPVGDELEDALASLWNSLLPAARNSPPTDTFTQLGGDSLQAIRLLLGVEEITRQPLGLSTFFLKPTFAGLCEAVRSRKVKPAFDPVLVLRKQGVRQPLFCLYALDGDVAAYFELAEALGDDQPVIGIRSPGLADLSRLPKTMEAAAAEVVRLIRSVHPRGCPALVGFSWAGLLAFEVARQLQETEGISGFTCLIGPAVPLRRTNPVHRLSHFVRFFPSWAWQIIQDRRNAASRFQKILKRLSILTSQKRAVASLDQPEWANSPVSRQLMDLAIAYHPQVKSSVLLNIFREREDFIAQSHPLRPSDTSYLPDGGWRRWTRNRPNVHWLDQGKHMLILKKPYVSKLARSIRSAMDEHFLRIAKTPTIPGTHCLR